MKKLLKKYGHVWPLLYIFLYMPWFMWLEKTITPDSEYTIVRVAIDDIIPFCEYFIVPYLLWFVYIPVLFIYIFFVSKKEFYQLCIYFFVGMSICLLVCTIWPNGQDLRMPDFSGKDNIFTRLLAVVYRVDTNTNVFPSIHSYNSFAAILVIFKSEKLKNITFIKVGSVILSILIILSTMFLKQHSILDAIAGVLLAVIMYYAVYVIDYKKAFKPKLSEAVNSIEN